MKLLTPQNQLGLMKDWLPMKNSIERYESQSNNINMVNNCDLFESTVQLFQFHFVQITSF
jgi:hypothetical protein